MTAHKIQIEQYSHNDKKRVNNPPVGLVSEATDKSKVKRTHYQHDPHIDPYLSWAGKKEGINYDVPDVSLHVHERIDPRRIVKAFLKKSDQPRQISLFEEPINEPPLQVAIDFYKHQQDWSNRLIAGDSLLVMNSLLQKEGMAGKLQMVFIDPPFGITYNSNFQPFVNKKDVRDKDEDLPAEPETIKAFRDTWELGIHSYLQYLSDRLILAKELLSETGSIFIQIGDENIHNVRVLLDEIFGSENFFSLITFRTTSGLGSSGLTGVSNYLLWYAKDKKQIKYHQLYVNKGFGTDSMFRYIELPDGTRRTMNQEELSGNIPKGARPFRLSDLVSSGLTPSCVFDFEYQGKKFEPGRNRSWKTNPKGMEQLAAKQRLMAPGRTLQYVTYFDDFPVSKITNMWTDTVGELQKIYAVQTSREIIKRCILMTTDPGDLVFDPTCGSGTTAHTAEEWGRRWITCDTSRVAIALAKQRVITANYPYYTLSYPDEGIASGFKYKTARHLTLRSITNEGDAGEEVLYDQPLLDNNKVRVTGPFTVEAVPSLGAKPFSGDELQFERTGEEIARIGETGNQAEWRDELKATGIRATGGRTINFSRIEPSLGTHYVHAIGEILEEGNTNKTAVISFGPDYGPIEQRQVEEVINEARGMTNKPNFVIFAAFQFDPEAAKDIDQIDWPGTQILKAQMSVDLLTTDLRKKRSSNQSYWLIGQPDVDLIKNKDGSYYVKVNGFDYYNPITGEIDSGSTKRVAMWFLDTDYDERSLFPDQVFFPSSDMRKDWTSLVKALNGAVDTDLIENFVSVESLPFKAGEHRRCAVKIIDDRGIESFVIKELR